MARIAFVVLLVIHGLVHGIGVARAFGLTRPAPPTLVPSRAEGLLWLVAGLSFLLAAGLVSTRARGFLGVAAVGVVLSEIAIVLAFRDAWAGTIPNAIVAVVIVLAAVGASRQSLRQAYDQEVRRGMARPAPASVVTEADVARLPAPLQTYLRRVGVVGRPRVRSYRMWFDAKMRLSPDGPWMKLAVEQTSFTDEPTRLFYGTTEMYGLPVEVLHRYVGSRATMLVRVAGLVDVADASGPKMNQSETVTLFNDLCVMAPAALVDADVTWSVRDERHVAGTFRNAGNEISAELTFDAAGDLVGFVSNDRYESRDGKTYSNHPWSTPLGPYRDYHGYRLSSHGTAIWKVPAGDFVYGEFEILDVVYGANGAPS
ncbi:MAG TPA: DUF6544 family protein [Polyangiaceae bacterium]|nr:DUF6544 family protein [Polyangiaceae bacterium]